MPLPLVSIVMPTFNQAAYIDSSVQSVLDQDYEHFELIIQDGASTDQTGNQLKSMSAREQRIRYSSEPDFGPADAINKAMKKARGEIIGWLNSDDLYTPSALSTVVDVFNKNPDWILCYGRAQYIDSGGNLIGVYPTGKPELGLSGFQSGCFICQPTVFFKASMVTLLGNLDSNLKTAFDFDYWLRAFTAFPERIGYIDRFLASSRLHADCITKRMRKSVSLEALYLMHKYLGIANSHWAVTYLEELSREKNHDSDQFKQEAAAFLIEANAYLDDVEIAKLRSNLNIDHFNVST